MIRRSSGAIKDFGGDKKVIILLHGFLASGRYWSKLQPYLTDDGYRVVTIDLLGFGKAPKPRDSDYAYDDHVAYVHRCIKELKLDAKFTLVGHSMGALIAARYCRLYPEHVSELVLLHPPLYQDMAEAYSTLRSTNRLYQFLLDSRYRRIGWIAIKMLSHYHMGGHSRLARERSLRNIIEKAEAFDDLNSLSRQTLLLIGSKDRKEYSNNTSFIPQNTILTVIKEDVTHHSPIRHPRLIYEKIIQFIE